MMAKIFVFLEANQSDLKKGSVELLSAAQSAGSEIVAGAIGSGIKTAASKAAHYGAGTVFLCEGDSMGTYNPEGYADVLVTMIKESGASTVLASASALSRDLMPRVAARLESGLASDCTKLEIKGDQVSVRRPLYAGKCSAEVEFVDSAYKFVLMRPNQLPVGKADAGKSASVRDFPAPAPSGKIKNTGVTKGQSTKADLTEANVIVSGGRGVQSADNFKILEDLANVLGATVGASRAVADAGWVPHSMQVGQTGKTVAPSLYIAAGISGAIQHLAGMSGSKVIVAINKDPDAPIFQKATYGIVGDLFEVVPKLTEEFKKVVTN